MGAVGTATSGSSEAIFLAIWAMKLRWLTWRSSISQNSEDIAMPHIVVGSHAHSSVAKGALACGVKLRTVPVRTACEFTFLPEDLVGILDQNTSGFSFARFSA